jgi:hypothetical protein
VPPPARWRYEAIKEATVQNNPYVAIELWKDAMRRAERAAELERMLPKRERRHLPTVRFAFPTIRRRARLATPHGC